MLKTKFWWPVSPFRLAFNSSSWTWVFWFSICILDAWLTFISSATVSSSIFFFKLCPSTSRWWIFSFEFCKSCATSCSSVVRCCNSLHIASRCSFISPWACNCGKMTEDVHLESSIDVMLQHKQLQLNVISRLSSMMQNTAVLTMQSLSSFSKASNQLTELLRSDSNCLTRSSLLLSCVLRVPSSCSRFKMVWESSVNRVVGLFERSVHGVCRKHMVMCRVRDRNCGLHPFDATRVILALPAFQDSWIFILFLFTTVCEGIYMDQCNLGFFNDQSEEELL